MIECVSVVFTFALISIHIAGFAGYIISLTFVWIKNYLHVYNVIFIVGFIT